MGPGMILDEVHLSCMRDERGCKLIVLSPTERGLKGRTSPCIVPSFPCPPTPPGGGREV